MSLYFIEKNGKQSGPYTLEELRQEKISASTLIWKEGLADWIPASQLKELKGILVPTPPPLPSKKPDGTLDHTYEKDTQALLLGIIIFAFNLYISISWGTFTVNEIRSLAWISLGLYIASLITVIRCANRQNRNTFLWAVFSLLASPIALISIGLTRKKIIQENTRNMAQAHPLQESVHYIEHDSCPACGCQHIKGYNECPDCGLSLK